MSSAYWIAEKIKSTSSDVEWPWASSYMVTEKEKKKKPLGSDFHSLSLSTVSLRHLESSKYSYVAEVMEMFSTAFSHLIFLKVFEIRMARVFTLLL